MISLTSLRGAGSSAGHSEWEVLLTNGVLATERACRFSAIKGKPAEEITLVVEGHRHTFPVLDGARLVSIHRIWEHDWHMDGRVSGGRRLKCLRAQLAPNDVADHESQWHIFATVFGHDPSNLYMIHAKHPRWES